jgi:hypothetical protein
MSIPARPPVQKIRIEVRDFSLDKAAPQYAAAIDAQTDRDDASDDFIKEKLHSNIRSALRPDYTPPGTIAIAGVRAALVGGLFILANPRQCLQLALNCRDGGRLPRQVSGAWLPRQARTPRQFMTHRRHQQLFANRGGVLIPRGLS